MLDTWLSIVILLEVLITLLILWGFRHEGEIILFEDLIIAKVKELIKR